MLNDPVRGSIDITVVCLQGLNVLIEVLKAHIHHSNQLTSELVQVVLEGKKLCQVDVLLSLLLQLILFGRILYLCQFFLLLIHELAGQI